MDKGPATIVIKLDDLGSVTQINLEDRIDGSQIVSWKGNRVFVESFGDRVNIEEYVLHSYVFLPPMPYAALIEAYNGIPGGDRYKGDTFTVGHNTFVRKEGK